MTRLSNDEFVRRANIVHNTAYDYSLTHYDGINRRVTVVCSHHGKFEQVAGNHLRGYGCKQCGYSIRKKKNTLSTSTFISRAIGVHGNTFDYTDVVYVGTQQKVKIRCSKHGVFRQNPNDHLSGKGCRLCAKIVNTLNQVDYVDRANKVHDSKYTYTNLDYTNMHSPVRAVCSEHGEFTVIAGAHLSGKGCDSCAPTITSYSKVSIEWLTAIEKQCNITIQHAEQGGEYKIPGTKYYADGFCHETNTVYEFYGDAYHGNPCLYTTDKLCHPYTAVSAGELYEKTMLRENAIRELGYNVVSIWEHDYNTKGQIHE